jgi:hypothetical protein
MTNRYRIFETLIIWYQVVIKLVTNKYLSSPWAQVKPKDFKITYQVNTNFPVGLYITLVAKVEQLK